MNINIRNIFRTSQKHWAAMAVKVIGLAIGLAVRVGEGAVGGLAVCVTQAPSKTVLKLSSRVDFRLNFFIACFSRTCV